MWVAFFSVHLFNLLSIGGFSFLHCWYGITKFIVLKNYPLTLYILFELVVWLKIKFEMFFPASTVGEYSSRFSFVLCFLNPRNPRALYYTKNIFWVPIRSFSTPELVNISLTKTYWENASFHSTNICRLIFFGLNIKHLKLLDFFG